MLEIKNINKKYNGNNTKTIKNCSYKFNNCGLYVISGPSGSGKTTLLGILSGLDNKFDGDLIYNDTIINKVNSKYYINDISSIVFQDINLIDTLNVEDNLRITYELCNKKYSQQNCIDILKMVNLPDDFEDINHFLKKKINKLSGGQKQRLAIARSIIKESKILFLDEPTSSLDEDNAKQIAKILLNLSKTTLIIIVTHTPEWFNFPVTIELFLSKGNLQVKNESSNLANSSVQNHLTEFSKIHTPSLYTSFKFSFKSITKSPFKLIVSLLITIISITSFLFFIAAKNIDTNQVLINNQLRQDNKLCIIQNTKAVNENNSTNIYGVSDFTSEQNEKLKSYDAHKIFNTELNITTYIDADYLANQMTNPLLYFMTNTNFSNMFLELWDNDDENFIEDERLNTISSNHFPSSYDEIAISSMCANLLLKCGSEKNGFKISTVDELIGKNLDGYKIVNIYTTRDDELLEPLITEENTSSYNIKKIFSAFSYSQLFYAAPGFYEYYQSLPKYDDSGRYDEAKRFYRSQNLSTCKYYAFLINNKDDAINKLNNLIITKSNEKNYPQVLNLYSSRIFFDNIMDSEVANYIFYISIVFLVLSLLSLLLLFTSNHKKQIANYGILKALGCSNIGILKLMICEIILISIPTYLLTISCLTLAFTVINSSFEIQLFALNLSLLLLLSIMLLTIIVVYSIINYLYLSKVNISSLLKDNP